VCKSSSAFYSPFPTISNSSNPRPPPLLEPTLTDTLFFTTGVKSYNVSLETQTADVTADEKLAYETVLEKIKKTGKTVNSGEADGVVMAIA
jgi:Heavy-metal-associated domain